MDSPSVLNEGEELVSQDGNYHAEITRGGELLIYKTYPNNVVFSSGKPIGKNPFSLSLSDKGNLAIWDCQHIVWETGTANKGTFPFRATILNDGILQITEGKNSIIWRSNEFLYGQEKKKEIPPIQSSLIYGSERRQAKSDPEEKKKEHAKEIPKPNVKEEPLFREGMSILIIKGEEDLYIQRESKENCGAKKELSEKERESLMLLKSYSKEISMISPNFAKRFTNCVPCELFVTEEKEYLCPIGLGVLNPFQSLILCANENCTKMFCSSCINSWLHKSETCPNCRQKFQKGIVPKQTKNYLLNLDVYCLNRFKCTKKTCQDCKCLKGEVDCDWLGHTCQCNKIACQATMKLGDLEKHLNECPYEKVKCKWIRCNEENLRGLIEEHQKTCKFMPYTCPICKNVFDEQKKAV